MELVLKEGSNTEWIYWAHRKAKNLKFFITVARIKKDNNFYKRDIATISEKIESLYSILRCDFEGEEIFQDERRVLHENLYTMNAQQFTTLANMIVEPYTDFEVKGDPDRT